MVIEGIATMCLCVCCRVVSRIAKLIMMAMAFAKEESQAFAEKIFRLMSKEKELRSKPVIPIDNSD